MNKMQEAVFSIHSPPISRKLMQIYANAMDLEDKKCARKKRVGRQDGPAGFCIGNGSTKAALNMLKRNS